MLTALRVAALTLSLALPMAGSAAIVQNGSFENPNGTWVNTLANYMGVATGSTAITNWGVVGAAGRGVAWAKDPAEIYFAQEGAYFVDLSGFGTEAGPNARLEQTLQNLIAGETYAVSIHYWGDRATLFIDGLQVGAAAAASGGWTQLTASFQAGAATAVLSVGYLGSSGVAFVDNLTVSGREAGTGTGTGIPEPGSLALAALALAAGAATRRR